MNVTAVGFMSLVRYHVCTYTSQLPISPSNHMPQNHRCQFFLDKANLNRDNMERLDIFYPQIH